jgi:cytochrome c biogenesis protein CcmG/thiol:disulfide interchange protein DsbE
MKMKLIKLICLILALMFVIVIAGCKKKEPEPAQQAEVKAEEQPIKPSDDKTPAKSDEKPAPMFTLQDLNGQDVSLSDFEGKVVILDFWATWCPPCKAEIPHFIELYKQYKDKGLVVIGIALDQEGIDIIKPFVQKYGIEYPVLLPDGQVAKAYGGINSIPTTFVIDSAGNVRQKYVGYRDKSVFEADIKELLPEPEVQD